MDVIKQAPESVRIAAVVGFYFTISISLVFVNKVLLAGSAMSVPAPLFITWCVPPAPAPHATAV